MKLLEIKNLRKSFGSNLVLDNVDFEIDSHQVKVLIGASGSGKSTLLRCINLLESIEDGEIFLEGNEITEFGVDKDEIRSNIGSVFQSFNLFPHLTVMQNLILAPTLVHKVSKKEAIERAEELLSRFGLSEKANQYPELLSGGQQQRVAILRAIMTKPKLLLLDEVTSALDPVLIAEVLTLINELKSEGITMIIATHEMGFAKQVADEVLYLKDGKIVESGTPSEIFDSPKSRDLQEFLGALRSAGRLDI
jgi:polar amino acid transport system ATP-binding protein